MITVDTEIKAAIELTDANECNTGYAELYEQKVYI